MSFTRYPSLIWWTVNYSSTPGSLVIFCLPTEKTVEDKNVSVELSTKEVPK